MAVNFDANATTHAHAVGVTTVDLTTLTVGGFSNRALVAQAGFDNTGITSVTVTWDPSGTNQSCTLIKSDNTSGGSARAELWGLVAPTSGKKVLRASWTGSAEIALNAVAWTGVNQTGGVTSFPNAASAKGTSTTPSVTVTSAVGNATMESSASNLVSYSAPSKTQTHNETTGSNIAAAGSRAFGAASNTHSWTLPSTTWVSVGTDIAAATIGGAFSVLASTGGTIGTAASTWSMLSSQMQLTAGGALIVGFGLGSSAVTITNVTDNVGNAFSLAVARGTPKPSSCGAEIWYANGITAGTTRISVTLSGNSSGSMGILHVTGMSTNTPLDLTGSSASAAVSSNHGASEITPTTANSLVVSYGYMSQTTGGAIVSLGGMSPWVSTNSLGAPKTHAMFLIQGAASTVSGSWRTSSLVNHAAVVAAFNDTNAIGGGGGGGVVWLPIMMMTGIQDCADI